MALDFNKMEEPDDSVFPVKLEDDSNLDMYGVWIKKRPEHKDDYTNDISTIENTSDNDTFEETMPGLDDNDIIDLDDSEESLEFEDLNTLNNLDDIDNEITFEEPDDKSSIKDDIYDDGFEIFDDTDDENYIMESSTLKDEKKDINEFETLDIDDFFSDEGSQDSVDKKNTINDNLVLDETTSDDIKLDLSFDEDYLEKKENNAIDFEGDEGFEIITDEYESPQNILEEGDTASEVKNMTERTIEDISDFDDIIDELESNNQTEEIDNNEIPLNITIDENSDITSIAGKTIDSDDDLENIAIFTDVPEFEDISEPGNAEKDDDLIIENTIIEAGNIDEIRKENQKIMASSSSEEKSEAKTDEIDDFDTMLDNLMGEETKTESDITEITDEMEMYNEAETPQENTDMFFDDIEALENDLLVSDISETKYETPNVPIETYEKENINNQSNIFANDKATEILIQIAGELSSIKNELATLKSGINQTKQKKEETENSTKTEQDTAPENIVNGVAAENDETGFFNDDDGDETIALTGDELNNILITADFTEENAEKDYEIPETLDGSIGDFLEDDDTYTDENDLLNSVEPAHINELDDDVSYLDEKGDINLSLETDIELENEINADNDVDFNSFETTDQTSIDIEDFSSNIDTDKEDKDVEDIDLNMTELELPDGQSIPLDDAYNDFDNLTEDTEEYTETSAGKEINIDEDEDHSQLEISEEDNDSVFSAEELDIAARDIPRLDLPENAAEEQKVKTETLPIHLKDEIKSVLTYMDQLLESLPEDKIEEFAQSEYFDTYKRLFDELGIS